MGVGGTVTEGRAGGSTEEIAVDVAARSDRVNGVEVAAGRPLLSAITVGVGDGSWVGLAVGEAVGAWVGDATGAAVGVSAGAATAASVAVGAGPDRLPGPQQTATEIRSAAARAMASRIAVLVLMPAPRTLRRCRRSWASPI